MKNLKKCVVMMLTMAMSAARVQEVTECEENL